MHFSGNTARYKILYILESNLGGICRFMGSGFKFQAPDGRKWEGEKVGGWEVGRLRSFGAGHPNLFNIWNIVKLPAPCALRLYLPPSAFQRPTAMNLKSIGHPVFLNGASTLSSLFPLSFHLLPYYLDPFCLCLKASYMATAAAAEALRESIGPCWGIENIKSQFFLTSGRIPFCSPPSTIAIDPVKSPE